MLSIGKINNIAYYEDLASEDYYTKGGEPQGQFIATQGNAALGIVGGVQDKQLTAMIEGFHPATGEALASNAGSDKKQLGLDLCFSAPKSVSVAWATSSDAQRQAISRAQQVAVERTLAMLESRAQVRAGAQGTDLQSARIFAATFEHSTSRATDPQLHTHSLIAAHGMAADGSIKSLHTFPIMLDKKTLGAAYRCELAKEMQKLGFSIDRDGESFKVLGSDEKLEKEWSKRRQDIERILKEKGYDSAKAAAVATLDSRETKENINRRELFEKWMAESKQYDLNFSAEFLESIKQGDAIDFAAVEDSLTNETATFDIRKIELEVMQGLQGKGSIEDMQTCINYMHDAGHLIKIAVDNGRAIFTTPQMLKLEKQVLDFHKSTADSTQFEASEKHIVDAINNKAGISEEQQAALRHIVGKGQLSCVIGAAGTGKSYMLDAAREVYEKSGHKVLGCAPTGKAAVELESSAGIKSGTIHALIRDIEKGEIDLKNTVVVMDEAGMTDSKLIHKLVHHVQAADAKLVMVGDNKQLQSIAAGGLFGKLAKDDHAAEILTVRRQEKEWSKDAANAFREGRTADALAAYQEHDALSIDDTADDAKKRIVSDFLNDKNAMPDKLLLTSKNSDVQELNELARKELKGAGKLGVEVSAVLTHATKDKSTTKTLELAENERIRFRANSKKFGVSNGDLATIKRLEYGRDGQLMIHAKLDSGKNAVIDCSKYGKIDHGYAITTHASQGATVNNTYTYASDFSNKELGYVAQSRHKQDATIYTSKESVGDISGHLAEIAAVEKLEKSMAKSSEKHTAAETLEDFGGDIHRMLEVQAQRAREMREQAQDKKQEQGHSLSLKL